MGRPLSKKYMGNRNIGTTGTADNGIGGEGVASVVLNALGNYTTRPTFTFSAPQLPGGVTATGTITSEASTVAPDGTLLAGSGYAVDDLITFAGITGVVGRVAVVGSGQQEIQSIDFVGAGTARGSFEALSGLTKTGLAVTVIGKVGGGSGSTGSGQTAAITFRAKAVVVTNKGSGYVTAPTSTPTQSVTFTSVALTTDSGAVGSATNQENAILAFAWIGGALVLVDLVKQISTKRYKVRYNGTNYTARIRYDAIADGTKGYTAAEGVELNMVAIDSAGGTYLVRKLYNRTCTLASLAINNSTIGITSNTAGTAITDGKQTKWSFAAASTGVVQVYNA